MKKNKYYYVLAASALLTILLTICFVTIDIKAAPNQIDIDECFPDSNLNREVRIYDSNQDGFLNAKEISNITELKGYYYHIQDFTGIEYLTNLRIIGLADMCNATSLDLSNNKKLEVLSVPGGSLESLTLPDTSNLIRIDCSRNNITSLDLTGKKYLEVLHCGGNSITALNTQDCTYLQSLNCKQNLISELTLPNSDNLTYLNCSENSISYIDISNLPNLQTVDISDNDITNIDLAWNTNLSYFYCDSTNIIQLDISWNNKLINCSKKLIETYNNVNHYETTNAALYTNKYTTLIKDSAVDYSISYDLNDGSLPQGIANPNTYNYKTEDIELVQPIRKGYRFTGWTGTDLYSQTLDVTIPQKSKGDRSYKANWVEKDSQNIVFNTNTVSQKYGNDDFNMIVSGAMSEVEYTSYDPNIATVDKETGRVSLVNSGKVTIEAKAIETDTYKEAYATYEVIIEKGDIHPSVTMDSFTFGSTSSSPSVNGNKGNGNVQFMYKCRSQNDSAYSINMPKSAGEYTVKAVISESRNFYGSYAETDFQIFKANIEPTVKINDWNYGSNASSPKVSNNLDNGSVCIYYKLTSEPESNYTDKVPQEPGMYNILAVISETDNCYSGKATSTFIINELVPKITIKMTGWAVNQEPNIPVVSGNIDADTYLIEYKKNGDSDINYTTIIPTSAGEYNVRVTVPETNHYKEVSAVTNFSISKSAINPSVRINNWTYGEDAQTPTVTGNLGNSNVRFLYKSKSSKDTTYSSTVPCNAGEYTVKAIIEPTGVYAGAETTQDFTINKANVSATVSINSWTFGEETQEPVVSDNPGNGETVFLYKKQTADDSEYSANAPSNAGDYIVKLIIKPSENYNRFETTCNFTINKAELKVEIKINNWKENEKPSSPTLLCDIDDINVTYKYQKSFYNSVSDEAPTKAGRYTLTAEIAESDNYKAATATCVFTVFAASTPTPATSTPTASDSKKDIRAFVDRIYNYVLGRESEEEGAKFWTDELYNFKRTGAEVAQGFIFSDEFINRGTNDRQFVDILYKTFFGRDSDEAGMNYWLSQLSSGAMDRITVANGFIYSPEWADTCARYGIRSGGTTKPNVQIDPTAATYAFVERMYTTAMNREYDKTGRDYWAKELANFNITGEQVGGSFFLSEEMTNYNLSNDEFINRLYKTFMDRNADQAGKDYWNGFLAQGNTREAVVYGFTRSPEFTDKCVEARILPF